jgi:sugar phosphate isomerase/epimerase
MRLGGPILEKADDPELWVQAHRRLGYSAALVPGRLVDHPEWISAYTEAAADAGILMAEVGAWSNTISADDHVRRKAIDFTCRRLDLAERIGARCCVNITGSRGERWDGPHPDNLGQKTFDLCVEVIREHRYRATGAHVLHARDDALGFPRFSGQLPGADSRNRPKGVWRAS